MRLSVKWGRRLHGDSSVALSGGRSSPRDVGAGAVLLIDWKGSSTEEERKGGTKA